MLYVVIFLYLMGLANACWDLREDYVYVTGEYSRADRFIILFFTVFWFLKPFVFLIVELKDFPPWRSWR